MTITAEGLTPAAGVLVGIGARSLIFAGMTHVPRYVPAKTNEGWGIVGLIALITAALIIAVTMIHKQTYKHPTDPTLQTGSGAKGAAAH